MLVEGPLPVSWHMLAKEVHVPRGVLRVQARTSNVPDFDFTMYAEQRLEQYHALKRLEAA